MAGAQKHRKNRSHQVAIKVASIYFVIGGLWVMFSDQLLTVMVKNLAVLTFLQTVKGWFFVLLTGLLLFWLIQREFSKRSRIEKMLREREIQIEESNQRYSSLIEYNSAAIYSIDMQGNFLNVNQAAVALSGVNKAELLQMNVFHFVEINNLPSVKEHFEMALRGQSKSYEIEILSRKGRLIHLGITNVPMKVNGQIVGAYGIVEDVTERKRRDELLRKSDKLALVGQLAAGVAHEIRNPLTAIKGFTQLLKLRSGDESGYYEIMLTELSHIEFIISEFLVLAKPQAVDFEPRNLQTLIHNITTLFDTQAIMSNVQILLTFIDEPLFVNCEENQLKQVFVNILNNAVEAMPHGGTICIEVDREDSNEALIRIMDEGYGMDEKRLANLGEPFYTTKEKGTGLGLTVSYKIIKDHEGQIDISSVLGRGTTVEIRLPICEMLRLVKS